MLELAKALIDLRQELILVGKTDSQAYKDSTGVLIKWSNMTAAERTKDAITDTRKFYALVVADNHIITGFTTITSETMYAAWCEALRTVILQDNETVLICPFNHLPEAIQKWTLTATPRMTRSL